MDVLALCKRILQRVDIRHMRGEPKLDLRIVGGEQDIAVFGYKCLTDGASDFGADRNVL